MKKKLLEKIIENQQALIDELSTELKLVVEYSTTTVETLCDIIEEQSNLIIELRDDKEDIADMMSPDLLNNTQDGEEVLKRIFGDNDGDPL